MELRHMQQVLEVCRAGGFTGAARKLRVSQPTLSKSIARLEEQLNIKLFERSRGATRPTPYGAFVAERAEAILQSAAALTRDLENLARGETGRLRIAVGPATRLKPLPRFAELIAEEFPGLQIQVLTETGPGVARALSEGKVDLAFGFAELSADYGDLVRKKLFEDRVVFVARPDHPLAGLTGLTPREILAYRLAHPGLTPGLKAWTGPLSRDEFQNARAFICDDYPFIGDQVSRSDLLSVGARFLFESRLERGELVELNTTLDMTYSCWMLTTADLWRSPIIKVAARLAHAAAAPPADPPPPGVSRPTAA